MSEEKRIVKSYEEEMQSLNDDLVKYLAYGVTISGIIQFLLLREI